MNRNVACFAALLAFGALPARAAITVTVNGNSASASVSLPGGLGADVTVSFESVVGLSPANLGLSAERISPTDPSLLSRLSGSAIPAGFPVLLRIEPPATGGLSFSGVATLEIHTHNLQFTPNCPLRLFAAPLGGRFEDITAGMGVGSYRARGTKGGFSEFLIVTDPRPVNQVIAAKFERLDRLLDEYASAVPGALYDDLEARLDAARSEAARGATLEAIRQIDGFLSVVEQHSGSDIPNVWRSARDLPNVAGYLRAAAMTLRFSLGLKSDLAG
ncbi:MAG TPA: DUF6689 family protein [Thermoanaerobaculia bacterium]|nr:DUF6689 family protein [Thermoanaerobaculia bacterium]